MKLRNSIMGSAALATAGAVLTSLPAAAAPQWYSCDIIQIGVTPVGTIQTQLSCSTTGSSFEKVWFTPKAGTEKLQLAIGITAQVTNQRVVAKLDPGANINPGDVGGEILSGMYLKNL